MQLTSLPSYSIILPLERVAPYYFHQIGRHKFPVSDKYSYFKILRDIYIYIPINIYLLEMYSLFSTNIPILKYYEIYIRINI